MNHSLCKEDSTAQRGLRGSNPILQQSRAISTRVPYMFDELTLPLTGQTPYPFSILDGQCATYSRSQSFRLDQLKKNHGNRFPRIATRRTHPRILKNRDLSSSATVSWDKEDKGRYLGRESGG
ncbi:hypothetical protein N7G274_004091 [Stereocaulon virgatum]|uniref:Uncharacterized protein n=1 Tax=Stereocaulon virgatum TaxID=373712 RepID=A0ABR4AAX9_9LECA